MESVSMCRWKGDSGNGSNGWECRGERMVPTERPLKRGEEMSAKPGRGSKEREQRNEDVHVQPCL